MKTRVSGFALLLIVTPLAAWADDQPQLSCVKDVTYSQEFLQKYPNAAAACREVAMKNGEKWIRFDADVAAVKGNQITANFLDTQQQTVSTITFAAAPDARLMIDGKESKYSSLQPGNRLTVWMSEKRAAFYAEPKSSPGEKLAVVSVENPKL
jgi:hypothetical protein